ncbi:MAG: hypothetical protein J6N51_00335 [Selenomonas sp.]|nr:hypothetical protein [Selenomonas sp.]
MEQIISSDDFVKQTEVERERIYGYDKALLAKKRRFDSLKDIEENLENSQFNIDLKGFHYECLFHHGEGKNLYVIYDGARYSNFPGFPRWGYYNLLPGSMLAIEDPMYYMYPDIQLGWFYGTKTLSLIDLSLEIVKAVCKHEGIKIENVIFFSSSGGGYAGIYAATLMEHTLAIALNPQLYIYDWSERQYEYFLSLGIDLRAEDTLMRNNLYPRIMAANSKFLIIYNSNSKHDWKDQMSPFVKELGILPKYGLTSKDNVLLWIYEAVGVPSPHTSFETKAIWLYMDYIAKEFYHDRLTEDDARNVFTINESWREIYLLRKELKDIKDGKNYEQNFLFLGNGNGTFRPPYLRGKANIASKDSAFNYLKVYNLDKPNSWYTIALNNVKCSVPEYTAGFFDFKRKQILHYEKCKASETKVFHCVVGQQVEGIAFVIYAGIAGHCQGQWVNVEDVLIGWHLLGEE